MTPTPTEILKQAGYPTEVLVLDFETYFDKDYSLRKMNSYEYIRDERFQITGLGLGGNFYPPGLLGGPLRDLREKYGKRLEGLTIVVANAFFDILVLKHEFNFTPKYVIDLFDLSRHIDSRRRHHSVGKLAERYGLQAKGDTDQFKGYHYFGMTHKMQNDLAGYCTNDCEIERQLFEIMLPQLTNPAVELKLMRHTLDLYLNPKITFDMELAKHLQGEFGRMLETEIAPTGFTPEELSGNLSFLEKMTDALDPDPVPMKYGKKGPIPAFAKNDNEMQALMVHPKKDVRALVAARLAVKSWPTHTKRVGNMIALLVNGRLPVPLRYYSAHTGRWGGSMKINLHNLAARTASELMLKMRALLCSGSGKKFAVVDSAQIEARVLAWLAGQSDLELGFANGEDVYSAFAGDLFNAVVRKARESDPPPVKKMLTTRRNFGKMGILASGFGMGKDMFYLRCLQDPGLKPYFDSGQYDKAFTNSVVATYRTKYSKIPKFWKTIEAAFKFVVQFPGEVMLIGLDGTSYPGEDEHTRLKLWCEGRNVHIQLPSGRVLYYPGSSVTCGQLSYEHSPLWGGLLTENLCQAIARDLLAYWLLECEEVGIPIVLHVHDELVGLVPEDEAEEALGLMVGIMRSCPDWAAGLPLDAEGQITEVYTK